MGDYTAFSFIPSVLQFPFTLLFFQGISAPQHIYVKAICVCVCGGGGSRQFLVLDLCKVTVEDEPWTTGQP